MQGISEQLWSQADTGKQPGSAKQAEEEEGEQKDNPGRRQHCNCDMGNIEVSKWHKVIIQCKKKLKGIGGST